MIRAKQTTAKELDETLVSLQNDGAQIWQVHPCPVNFKGQQEDMGKGQTNFGATLEMNFMVTYSARPKAESPNVRVSESGGENQKL